MGEDDIQIAFATSYDVVYEPFTCTQENEILTLLQKWGC